MSHLDQHRFLAPIPGEYDRTKDRIARRVRSVTRKITLVTKGEFLFVVRCLPDPDDGRDRRVRGMTSI